jgi:hypothetical protein
MDETDSAPGEPGTDGIACTLTGDEIAERREMIRTRLFPHLRDLDVVGDRVTMTLDDDALDTASEYVRLEHECCSFLAFDLHVTPHEEPIELELSGEGVGQAFEEGLRPMVEADDPGLLA